MRNLTTILKGQFVCQVPSPFLLSLPLFFFFLTDCTKCLVIFFLAEFKQSTSINLISACYCCSSTAYCSMNLVLEDELPLFLIIQSIINIHNLISYLKIFSVEVHVKKAFHHSHLLAT